MKILKIAIMKPSVATTVLVVMMESMTVIVVVIVINVVLLVHWRAALPSPEGRDAILGRVPNLFGSLKATVFAARVGAS